MAINYSILADVELNTTNIQKQLNNAAKDLKVSFNTKKVKNGAKDIDNLSDSMNKASLTFQAANEIFSKSIEIIGAMVEQVYELDAAMIEFQKVSDLSGQALDDYIVKLSDMGSTVARTGKPKCQAPDVRIVNVH